MQDSKTTCHLRDYLTSGRLPGDPRPADRRGPSRLHIVPTIRDRIKVAEDLFSRSPGLKITPIWNWNVPRTGLLRDNNLEFYRESTYHKWMDENFDNIVGASKDDGCLQVLYVDSFSLGTDSVGGAAFFPQKICGRKHGIVSEYQETKIQRLGVPELMFEGVLAHELGHIFSLRHTFVSYYGLTGNCNREYDKQEKSTLRPDGSINVMDYWPPDTVSGFYLNDCQQDRAARQRRRYLTKDGNVNYRALKRNW